MQWIYCKKYLHLQYFTSLSLDMVKACDTERTMLRVRSEPRPNPTCSLFFLNPLLSKIVDNRQNIWIFVYFSINFREKKIDCYKLHINYQSEFDNCSSFFFFSHSENPLQEQNPSFFITGSKDIRIRMDGNSADDLLRIKKTLNK